MRRISFRHLFQADRPARPQAWRRFRLPVLAWFLAAGCRAFCQAPDTWPEPGPPFTRDLYPLNFVSLTYRPTDATTLGEGRWLASLTVTRANIFDFSDAIKDLINNSPSNMRIRITRAGVDQFAQAHAQAPLLYFWDTEVQREDLQVRYGLTASTDLALTLAWQGWGGGFLDGPIEDFHSLGFAQSGRDAFVRYQSVMFVIQYGKVTYYSQGDLQCRVEDPVLTMVHRFYQNTRWTVSLQGTLQVPATHTVAGFSSDWDTSFGPVLQWRPTDRQVVDGEFAYIRRRVRTTVPSPFAMPDQKAGHVGWEWRGWKTVHPYFYLIATSGLDLPEWQSKMDKLAFYHDAGINIRLGRDTTLSFSYINNISHNENTADCEFALRLAVRSRPRV
jgi:hypothetical protein